MSWRIGLRAISCLLVFGTLAGAAWWGHRSGWALPGMSENVVDSAKAKDDWCEAHSVPKSICVECDERLLPRPKAHGWCRAHGVQECPLCHPEIAQLTTAYVVKDADRERARRALAAERLENSKSCKLPQRRIQFSSAEAFKRAGLDIDPVRQAAIRETIPVYGEIAYDPARIAHLSSRCAGSVARVFKHLGDRVEPGDVLALVDAADVGKAKAEYLQALVQREVRRKAAAVARNLMKIGTGDQNAVALAEASVREAGLRIASCRQSLINLGLPRSADDFSLLAERAVEDVAELDLAQKLHFLGIPEPIRKDLNRDTDSSNLMPLRAPLRGVIVSREIVPGEVVDTNRTLFEVVDTSRVWLSLDVRAEDVAKIDVGSKAFFKPDGHLKEIEGTIHSISTEADPKTRTVKARVELANADGKLRANTFGSGRIVLREEPAAIVAPNSAVHWEGDCHVVFVRDKNWLKEGSPKVFHTRVVRVGMRDEKVTEIIAGLLPGEVVASTGSEILRAELLKDKLGDGCAHCAGKK